MYFDVLRVHAILDHTYELKCVRNCVVLISNHSIISLFNVVSQCSKFIISYCENAASLVIVFLISVEFH